MYIYICAYRLLQIVFCTGAFTLFPFLGGVELLENYVGSAADLVDIRRFDEAVVVGASLALSSSAFVLKLLQEKGQLTERVGSASLGVLLMQDITVVPLLVGLPLIVQEQIADSTDAATMQSLVESAAVSLGGLAFLTVRFSIYFVNTKKKQQQKSLGLVSIMTTSFGSLRLID